MRRGELAQESFAKFARFDDLTSSTIRFARGIQVYGPLHTNQTLYVDNTGGAPTFHGPVTTASGISVASEGIFRKGYKENVAAIAMPTPAALATLSAHATSGGTWVAGGAVGTGEMDPSTRIEFVPVDINLDGDFSDENEGFFRVFRATGTTNDHLAYVSARRWPTILSGESATNDPNLISANCGGIWTSGQGAPVGDAGMWRTARYVHTTRSGSASNKRAAAQSVLAATSRRCYLGGDQRLYPGYYSTPAPAAFFTTSDTYGAWQSWAGWAGSANASVSGGRLQDGRTVGDVLALHLWPATREFNLNFKGVIYVSGSVAVSGQLRGRVTLAASGNIMLADDLTYVMPPGNDPDCQADILGLLTPQFLMLEDNSVNSPFRVAGTYRNGHDDSPHESLHGAVLTLESIQTEDVMGGSTNSETCVGLSIGRGCFNMFGSAIQKMNGSRMGGTGTGWNPQWTYDKCMAVAPPPYYPTTGRYYMNRHYEIDPVGFDPAVWFTENQSGI